MLDNIFTIRKFIGSAMFPLVFSLLPKRDKDTSDSSLFSKRYAGATTKPYRQLQSAWTSSVLQHIAVVDSFPIAELKGCLFHYCKAIWKKTQECGLQRDYKILHEVNMLVRRAAALPFLPLVKVMDYWLHIQENAPDREDCTKLTDYVTETCKRKKTVKKYREVEERLQHLKTQLTSGRKLPPVWRFSILYFEAGLI